MWKKYLIVGVVVLLLLLVALQASAQGRASIEEDPEMWVKAIEEAYDTKLDSTQRDSVKYIVRSFGAYGDGDSRKLVYILATAWHESKLRPVKERRAKSGTALYERQNRYWPTGYYGRGFVQLTWESNYRKMSEKLGVNLVDSPDLALKPEYAAEIITYGMMEGKFTGKALSNYINLLKTDYYNARRVVNGTDKASLIKGYATKLERVA